MAECIDDPLLPFCDEIDDRTLSWSHTNIIVVKLCFDGGKRAHESNAGGGAVMYIRTSERSPAPNAADDIWHPVAYIQHCIRSSSSSHELTNNIAEYQSLIDGLRVCCRWLTQIISCRSNLIHSDDIHLLINGDSLLVINQLKRIYQVKAIHLKPYFVEAISILEHIDTLLNGRITIEHIRRNFNKDADELANDAMDNEKSFIVYRWINIMQEKKEDAVHTDDSIICLTLMEGLRFSKWKRLNCADDNICSNTVRMH